MPLQESVQLFFAEFETFTGIQLESLLMKLSSAVTIQYAQITSQLRQHKKYSMIRVQFLDTNLVVWKLAKAY